MSPIRTFKFLLIFSFLLQITLAGVLKPENAKKYRDILVVSGNRSSYYVLKDDPLTLKVEGPQRIKIYSRAVLNKRKKDAVGYRFQIKLNGDEPLNVYHKQKRSRGVKSPQHPNHYFTKAAIDYVLVPKGVNTVTFLPSDDKHPVLLRILEDEKKVVGEKTRVSALTKEASVMLKLKDKNLPYYQLKRDEPLYVNLDGNADLEIISRLVFDSKMGRQEDYRIQVHDGKTLLGTYYFSTERSETSVVTGQEEIVPGKWRSCLVNLGSGRHEIRLRLLDRDREVFVRLNKVSAKE